jgi:signal transduction histidine kinase
MRPARPVFNREVEAVIAPTYARREELEEAIARMERAVEEMRRLVADQAEASLEAETVLGREVAALRDAVEQMEEKGRG